MALAKWIAASGDENGPVCRLLSGAFRHKLGGGGGGRRLLFLCQNHPTKSDVTSG